MLKRTYCTLVLPLAAAGLLAGCGLFDTESNTDFKDPFFPDREAAKVVANISSRTRFNDPDDGKKSYFVANLFDTQGQPFYGPKVELNGEEIASVGTGTTANYQKSEIAYAAGQTWTVAVQGHAAVSEPAIPPVLITSPATTKDTSGVYLAYQHTAGQPLTVTWTAGDPTLPVYVVIFGNPDNKGDRRFFVRDNVALRPNDPENYGLPIDNTGSVTIPATLEERMVDSRGNTTFRTVTMFDNPSTSSARTFTVYVVQRKTTLAPPIQFSVNSLAYAIVSVPAKTNT